MRNRIYPIVLVAMCCRLALSADAPISSPGAMVGVYIAPIAHDSAPCLTYNADVCMAPASTMKTLTSATALSLLGRDYRWATTVEARGPLVDGILLGDIVINGSGDPTLESRFFPDNQGLCSDVAAALASVGCREVAGSVVVNSDAVADTGINPSWELEDVAWDYGAGYYALNYRDNSFRLRLPEGSVEPTVPGLKIVDNTEADSISDPIFLRGFDSNVLRASGRYRASGDTQWCAMPDPSAAGIYAVDSALTACGIRVDNEPVVYRIDRSRVILTHYSPALSEVLHSLMVRSDNLMAEGALRAIAPGATRSDAIARMREVWLSRGIDIGPTRIFDGSGLARGNALSPHMLAQVLTWMAHSDCAADYLALFPRPGQGTLRTFLADQSQRSRFALKTGSMGGVQCYAGYHLDEDDNPTHVVVIMVNNFTEKRADLRRSIEDLLTATFPQ